jgi:hypothetical protein
MELKVQKANAILAYKQAGKEGQKILRDIFGRDVFEPFNFDELDENERAVLAAYSRLRAKAKEKRGSWIPDYTDNNQRKYYTWFDYKGGVGFVVYDTSYGDTRTLTAVGSRLSFPTSEMAIEFANENLEDYNTIFLK